MKFSLKRLLPLACAAGLFMACSLTVFAGNLPTLSAETDKVSVSHEDTSTKVKVKVKEWKSSNPFVVKFAVDDSSVAKVELDSQKSDSFKLKIKAKGTGAEYTEKFFGFSIASEKEIHLLVTPAQGRNAIMKAIMEQAGLESKAQSIVFSLPVSHALGLRQPE